jgi:Ice-binding-like/PEP-CTERM motif
MKLHVLAVVGVALWPFGAQAVTVQLGTAASFAVLGATAVTNTGPSVINGNLGIYPNGLTSITGFPPGIVNGTVYAADGVAEKAQADALTAYNYSAGLAPIATLGMQLGGVTLTTPGVYDFSSSAVLLDGPLTLEGTGTYVFQIASTLTTGANDGAAVVADCGCDVYWDIGSSATIGTDTAFEGTILAVASVTVDTGATIIDGRAIALNAAVTLDDNTITATQCIPEPSTWAMMLLGFAGLGFAGYRQRRKLVGAASV